MKTTALRPHPFLGSLVALGLLTALQGCAPIASSSAPRPPLESLTEMSRLEHIRRAQVWNATDVGAMDLRAGPPGVHAFSPEQEVACDYVDEKQGGSTPKFSCLLKQGDDVKVKYGADNGEVYAAVLGSRLFWALGFGADAFYPVRVTCRGCSKDPWNEKAQGQGQVAFESSIIERKMEGATLESREDQGWKWSELDSVDESAGGAPRAHRDALKLLASLVEHIDSKGVQQRLICLSGDGRQENPGQCDQPFLMVHDLGVTFGSGGLLSRHLNDVGAANFKTWAPQTVFRDEGKCVGSVSRSFTGTLNHPEISEGGRQFLSDLLEQLSDRQLHDLFEVARVDQRPRNPRRDDSPASVDEWVDAFKRKREEIKTRRCPEETP
jgi:hypothetical protein